jgi:hypothetical protein
LIDNIGHGHGVALIKRISGVAIATAKVASGQTHEHAGQPGIYGLALNTVKDFINRNDHVINDAMPFFQRCTPASHV